MRNEFWKMFYEDWDEGCECLSIQEEGAYLRITNQFYRRRNSIANDLVILAGVFRCHPTTARAMRDALLAKGKIFLDVDGRLFNRRVREELHNLSTTSAHRAQAASRRWADKQQSRPKSLKNNEATDANV